MPPDNRFALLRCSTSAATLNPWRRWIVAGYASLWNALP